MSISMNENNSYEGVYDTGAWRNMSVGAKELGPKGLAWELREEHGDSLTRSPPSRRRAPVSHTPPPSSSPPAPVRAITYPDHRVHS